MGFFDMIKKAASGTVKAVKYMQFEKKIKKALLNRFAMRQLEAICISRGISLQVEGKRGKRRARSKDELIPKLMKLDLDEIVRLAKKYGIKYQDLLDELEEFKRRLNESEKAKIPEIIENQKPSNILDEVLDIIENEFVPETIRDEEDLEKQLALFLKLKIGNDRVRRQEYRDGKKIDLVIDGIYGIELKLADSYQSIATLPTQLRMYSKRLSDVAAVIVKPKDKDIDIDEILEILREDGFKYVVLNADVKR